MKRKARIVLEFDSEEEARIIYEAVLPEAKSMPTERTKASIIKENNLIELTIEADSTSSLRAALNSYLSWFSSILKTVKYVREVEKHG
ncbi:MAG: hypothetical protein B6U75_03355 [Desulfurococcales archaeon ex4484_217_1]|nr:MAG: hypothetical protein B6U75_03355 [Desulfurococcales archaeon ex4484_217_1]